MRGGELQSAGCPRLPCWKGVMRLDYFRQSPKAGTDQKVTVWLSPWTMKTAAWLSVKDNLLGKTGQKDKKKNQKTVLVCMQRLKKLKS